MTTPERKPVDLEAALEELEDEEELERLETMSHEELLAEMKRDGLDPERGRAAVQRAIDAARGGKEGAGGAPAAGTAGEDAKGKVVRLDAAKKRRTFVTSVYVGLALAAGAATTVGLIGPQTIAAWLSPAPAPTGTTPPIVPPTHEETPLEKARRLREEAFADVKEGYYGEAWDRLEEAKGIDPKGDEAGEVQKAWEEVQAHKRVPHGFVKPGVGPGEVPLKRTPPKQP
jgi:hypothetical protein